MYPGTEAKMKTTVGGVIGGAAACQSVANQTGPRDLSPIQQQLQRQSSLLNELHAVAHSLIDSIKPVLRYDPREIPQPDTTEKAECASCAMEQKIEISNEVLDDKIRLLRQVHEVICL